MIYWFCPPPTTPSGGVWFIHRLAALSGGTVLSENLEPVWWDDLPQRERAPIDTKATLKDADTVFIPEVTWQTYPLVRAWPGRKLVFLQNYIWASHNPTDYDGVELVTVSRFLDNWCRRVLGKTPVGMFSPYLDDGPWHPSPKTTDRTLIFTRRNAAAARAVAAALSAENFPVDLVEEPLSQLQIMSRHLAHAEFYVHLNSPEGWPMACAEAMLAGVICCGTTGGGGNEFMFHRETAMVVQDPTLGRYEDPDNAEFARRIVEQMLALRAETDLRSKIWQSARNWIRNRYSKERTLGQLKAVLG